MLARAWIPDGSPACLSQRQVSGHHYRNKNYIYKEGVLYKLDCNQGIEVKRVTKELSGILTNIGYQRSI